MDSNAFHWIQLDSNGFQYVPLDSSQKVPESAPGGSGQACKTDPGESCGVLEVSFGVPKVSCGVLEVSCGVPDPGSDTEFQ